MLKSLVTLAWASFIFVAVSGSANGQISNPGQFYDTINADTLTQILTEAEIGFQVQQTENGIVMISTMVDENTVMMIGPDNCTGGPGINCSSMGMAAMRVNGSGLPFPDVLTNLAAINSFNLEIPIGKFVITPSGVPVSMRIEIIENGTTKGHLFSAMGNTAVVSAVFFVVLDELGESAAAAAFSAPLGSALDAGVSDRVHALAAARFSSRELSSSALSQWQRSSAVRPEEVSELLNETLLESWMQSRAFLQEYSSD